MNTITILAKALAQATKSEILRLDIQYSLKEEHFIGYLTLANNLQFGVFEDGTITRLK